MRSFTVDEVNTLIPQLQALFSRLAELRQEIAARANEIERMGFNPATTQAQQIPEQVIERRRIIDARVADFQREVARIAELGGVLDDLDLGLVDFPSELRGARVLLCWQLGDVEVTHYRSPDAERSARKPLHDAPHSR